MPSAPAPLGRSSIPLRICLIYAVVGGTWIFLSETLLPGMVREPGAVARLPIYMEWSFIAVTSLTLYGFLRRAVNASARSEQALRDSEGKFHMLVENTASAIFIYREKMLAVNPAMEALTGYKREELLAMSFADLVHPDLRAQWRLHCEALAHGEELPTRCECRLITKTGEERWVDFTSVVISFNGAAAGLGTAFDITERRLAEDLLQKERDKAQKYLDVVGVMVVVINADQRVSLINRKGCNVLGYEEKEIVGRNWFDTCVPARFRDGVKSAFDALMSGDVGAAERFENPVLTKTGEERIISWSNTLLRDPGGEIRATLSSGEDITERKRTETALLSAEQRFRTLVEQALVGIYFIREGRFIYVNPRFEEIFGYSGAEILSMPSVQELVAEVDRPLVAENVRKRLQGEVKTIHYTFRGLRKDGAVVDIEAYGTTSDLEGGPVIIGVLADITERVRAEAALRESETNLRIILDSVYDAIFIHDVDGAIIDVNDKMLTMYGVTREEALALTIRDDYSSPENPLDSLPRLWKRVVAGEPQFFEWKARRPGDGTVFDVEVFLCRITLKSRDAILANVRDIAGRKRAEAALRESEERIRLLLASAEDIIVMQDLEGTYLYYNAAPRYGLKAEEVLGRTPFDFFDPGTAGRMMEQIRQVAVTGNGLSAERQTVLQGELMCFLDQVSPVRNADGSVRSVVRISRNITERKRSEEALERSHRQNRLLLESVGEGIYGVDSEGRGTFVNPEALAMFGYGPGELDGRAMHGIVHHTRADGTPYPLEECPTGLTLKDGAVRRVTDEVFWRKDGTRFPVEYVCTPILEREAIIGSVVIFNDITDRKTAEAALRESEERYRVMAETASDVIIVIDAQSRVLFANPALLKVFGYRPEEMIGREVTTLMPERLRGRHLAGLNRYLTTGQKTGRWEALEYAGLHRDGHEIPIELSYGDFAREGRHYFAAFIRDITERKEAEKEKEYKDMLERFNHDLEALITERTMSLMALKLADRVRNPAAVIGWTAKRLLGQEGLSEKSREGLLDVVREADSLEVTVKEFQSVLKSGEPLFSFDDINRIVQGVLPVIEREAAEKKVALEVKLSERPLRMNVQRDLLRMAVFNLLRNALEAAPEGGNISVATGGDARWVSLAVSDTGLGMPKEVIARVFDPYFSMKVPGFRIGLPLIKQIVSEHLGRIEVESEVGKGTTFRLLFPVRWTESMQNPARDDA